MKTLILLLLAFAQSSFGASGDFAVRNMWGNDYRNVIKVIVKELQSREARQLLEEAAFDHPVAEDKKRMREYLASIGENNFTRLHGEKVDELFVTVNLQENHIYGAVRCYISMRLSGFSKHMTGNAFELMAELAEESSDFEAAGGREHQLWTVFVLKYGLELPVGCREFFSVGAAARVLTDGRRSYIYDSSGESNRGMIVADFRLIYDRQFISQFIPKNYTYELLLGDQVLLQTLLEEDPDILKERELVPPDLSECLQLIKIRNK